MKINEDCFAQSQMQSKAWLVKELSKLDLNLGTVFLCAGWYATLATLLFENHRIKVDKIRSFDVDDSCWKIAEIFNKPWIMEDAPTNTWRDHSAEFRDSAFQSSSSIH